MELIAVIHSRRVVRAAAGDETTGNYIVVLAANTDHSKFESIVDEVRKESADLGIRQKLEGPFGKHITAKLSHSAVNRVSEHCMVRVLCHC